jgi:hypothetical protein
VDLAANSFGEEGDELSGDLARQLGAGEAEAQAAGKRARSEYTFRRIILWRTLRLLTIWWDKIKRAVRIPQPLIELVFFTVAAPACPVAGEVTYDPGARAHFTPQCNVVRIGARANPYRRVAGEARFFFFFPEL